jgi:ABC-type Mn2+/Zn2+ transport system permease subunit
MMFGKKITGLIVAFAFFGGCGMLTAAPISSQADGSWLERSIQFLSMQDASSRVFLLGTILIGANCGLMGGYVVSRRLSMFGDTLSHAVLPGIAVGYMFSQTRNEITLMTGATLSGFIGVGIISLLKRHTKMKEDSAMGLVLSAFYALGICLITHLQKSSGGGMAGLESYLFGSIVSLSSADLLPLLICFGSIFFIFVLFGKELLVCGFDPSFARSTGLPVDLLQFFIWILLAFCIVCSLQIIGVVLVSALLIIPATTAGLLTYKMNRLLVLSGALGAFTGIFGCLISILSDRLPAGPVIVICSTLLFIGVLFLGPNRGILPAWFLSRKRGRRISMENTLKACYQVLEEELFANPSFPQSSLARRRRKSDAEIEQEVDTLVNQGYATRLIPTEKINNLLPAETMISLTPDGWELACKMIRNHRLWELYLTQEASYPSDHVHDDAEKIEHVIGEKTVRRLERILSNPQLDPHGKLIPSQNDIERGWISRPFESH